MTKSDRLIEPLNPRTSNVEDGEIPDNDNDDVLYEGDGIDVNVNTSDDDFQDDVKSDEGSEVVIRKLSKDEEDAQIAEEVEQWKCNPAVMKFFQEIMQGSMDEMTQPENPRNNSSSQDQHRTKNNTKGKTNKSPVVAAIKSPSDMTIYQPAFKRGNESNDLLNKISNFVENIRRDSGSSRRVTPTVTAHENK